VGYTPSLEKAHFELRPGAGRPRLSAGLGMSVMARLRRHGGSAYMPRHAVDSLVASGFGSCQTRQ
jgi:hypothetical protein